MHLLLLSLACTGGDTQDTACELSTFYLDADGDGFGDESSATQACEAPTSHIAQGGDCDDLDAGVHPEAQEVCGGVDEDCDGLTDSQDDSLDLSTHLDYFRDADGDGYGSAEDPGVRACDPPEGTVADSSDCDDTAAEVHPAASEVCDGIDNDCDALIDDEDEDRIGATDWYADLDQDGYGAGDPVQACSVPESHSAVDGDCEDSDSTRKPGAEEVCGDGVVNDCDGDLEAATAQCTWSGTLNASSGEYDALLSRPSSDLLARAMSQGDLNGDGQRDFVIGGWVGSGQSKSRVVLGPVSANGSTEDGLEITGESSDFLGAGSAVGDVNGDGQEDLLLGALGQGEGGAFYLFQGPITADLSTSQADLILSSGTGELGSVATLLGDQDGDGVTELALGSSDSTRKGSVYVVSGALSGTQDLADVYSAKVSAPIKYNYSANHNGVADGTDVDGDGVPDLVMGVPFGAWHESQDGYVSIWSGPLSGDHYTDDAEIVLHNSETSDSAAVGMTVQGGFDWNGDGYEDLYVGAPRQETSAGTFAGEAFITLGPISADIDLAEATLRIQGGAASEYLGGSVDVVDVNGDGDLDLLVGSGYTTFGDSSASYNNGTGAWLFLAPADGELSSSDADQTLTGSEGFGIEVAVSEDQNADGELELMVLDGKQGLYFFQSPHI